MQSVLNSVKGTALGVAEYLTPVLKVHFIYLNFASEKFPLIYLLFTMYRNLSSVKREF